MLYGGAEITLTITTSAAMSVLRALVMAAASDPSVNSSATNVHSYPAQMYHSTHKHNSTLYIVQYIVNLLYKVHKYAFHKTVISLFAGIALYFAQIYTLFSVIHFLSIWHTLLCC